MNMKDFEDALQIVSAESGGADIIITRNTKDFTGKTVIPVILPIGGLNAQILGSTGAGWSMRGTDPIEVYFGDKLVTNYHAGYEEGKPFFYPIIGPNGENMTRDWPGKKGTDDEADQPPHRGMWYGLSSVNGFDFRDFQGEEAGKDKAYGVIRHKGMNGVMIKGPTITFKTKSDWLDAANPVKRICSDKREFILFYREDGSLVIDFTLSLIADAGDLTIGENKAGAWAIRTLSTLNLKEKAAKWHLINSEGLTGAEVLSKRAAWVDAYGPDRAGNPVGIAILDHPSNFHHPTGWHAQDDGLFAANPFGQGDVAEAASDLTGEKVIPNGESLVFRYRTIFHQGDATVAGIAKAFEAYSSK